MGQPDRGVPVPSFTDDLEQPGRLEPSADKGTNLLRVVDQNNGMPGTVGSALHIPHRSRPPRDSCAPRTSLNGVTTPVCPLTPNTAHFILLGKRQARPLGRQGASGA
jgi:hypothetical protein